MKSKTLKISTKKKFEIIDITLEINEFLDDFSVDEGIVNIFSKHSTSAIVVNENEEGLLKDFKKLLNDLILEDNSYLHDKIDNNASSHLKSFFLSSSENIPVSNGKLNLGFWQSVFFIELDGPRKNREIVLSVIK